MDSTFPRTIVITGASDGIGAAAARLLSAAGHHVAVVGRSPEKTAKVAREVGGDHFVADFTRLADVRRLAAELDHAYPRIDVLANNAGGILGDRTKTADGHERTLQVNHLAPFLLTGLLLDKLLASRASVIQTSSAGARLFGHLDLDDLDHDRDFTPHRAYGTAKLENILFTTELHRRFHDQGLSSAAFHPGVVATSFGTESTSLLRPLYQNRIGKLVLATPERGAAQLVRFAQTEPGVGWQSGEYYERGRVARRVNPQARDADLARRLWDRTAELTGVAAG
ncbi:SDR family NAD(P)-dependent oxidoreductase [Promicromonospora iranensis]|uniref:NAD(P)-dependent dehydrogenase (Short-subunit alcohol dehydrogenase family) n=1 Tax=Promicromonospora iranensis TaxID=1105144 RepID=A0ABU2CWK9_9MICO|nr:SDR family NAD(P)-dependent oxidoreductase [Promicromonospora iranensis]MDR7385728.1 NAD(P)-dependent dehydrogenase (short-subunit alcohol dehydrogenase family) [Promicromonospora iranensis]